MLVLVILTGSGAVSDVSLSPAGQTDQRDNNNNKASARGVLRVYRLS